MIGFAANTLRLLIVSFVVFPLSAQTPASLDHPDRLHGTVINTVAHEPIPRALVYSQDNRLATFTDDHGRFEFPIPKPDTDSTLAQNPAGAFVAPSNSSYANNLIVLAARKLGFLARHNGQETVIVDPTQLDVTLYLVPEAHIVGRIVLPGSIGPADYSDLAPIRVTLLRREVRDGREHWDMANSVAARSNGEFRFFGLAAGTYKLLTNELLDRDPLTTAPRGQRFGFPPVFFPSSSDVDSSSDIHLSAGESFQATITLARREYYAVRLPVTNAPSHVPFQVQVWPVGHPGPGYALGFDFRQRMVSGLLPNGTYSVLVSSFDQGTATGTGTFTVRGGPVTSPSIALVPNPSISVFFREELSTATQSVNLEADGGARNVVSTDRRQSDAPYSVTLVPENPFGLGNEIRAGVTSNPEKSYYEFSSVPPGRYHVKVLGNVGYAAAITAGVTDLLHQPLVVDLGAAPSQIEVTIRDDGGTISGEVIAFDEKTLGQPRPSSVVTRPVYFFPVSGNGIFTTAWASPEGKFQVQNLAPGIYNVLAFDRQQTEIEQEAQIDVHRYESQSRHITVAPSQTQSLRIPLIQVPE